MAKGKRTAAEMVTRLCEIGTDELCARFAALGLQPEHAAEAMRHISHKLCREWGGMAMYVPKDDDFERAQRNLAMWKAFDGTNQIELATQYGLTVVQVYSILKTMQAEMFRKTQPKLPGFDDPADN